MASLDFNQRPTSQPIRVLIVEDSPAAQMLLERVVNSDSRLTVSRLVGSGEAALDYLERHRVDVIVMDVHLPGIDGYTTTQRIMETRPVPIIICSSSLNPSEVNDTFRAIQAGAIAVAAKPAGPGHRDHEKTVLQLLETIRLMAEVKVIRRWPTTDRRAEPVGTPSAYRLSSFRAIAIGASTGGPPVLMTILAGLPRAFPLPIAIVQHIAAGFLPGLAEWLYNSTGFPVTVARHGELLTPGRAYLAPDGYHLGVGAGGHALLSRGEPEHGVRPAISYLFRSLTALCRSQAVGILLTGMGRDGADELKQMREAGGITIAQDADSATVNGMPGTAVALGAATHVLPPGKIPALLTKLIMNETTGHQRA